MFPRVHRGQAILFSPFRANRTSDLSYQGQLGEGTEGLKVLVNLIAINQMDPYDSGGSDGPGPEFPSQSTNPGQECWVETTSLRLFQVRP